MITVTAHTLISALLTGGGGAGPVAVTPDQAATMLISLVAIVGFMRGMRREIVLTAFVAAAYLMIGMFGDELVKWSNHFWRLLVFAVIERGVFVDDPAKVFEAVKQRPPLVGTADERKAFEVAMFAFIVTLGYLWPSGKDGALAFLTSLGAATRGTLVITPTASNLSVMLSRLIGALMGSLNGYAMLRFMALRLSTDVTAIILPRGEDLTALQGHLVNAVLLLIVLVILYGVLGAPGKGRSNPAQGDTGS